MPTSTDNPQSTLLPITFFINAAKIVQIERNTKEKQVFLCITEMQPIFGEAQRYKLVRRKPKKNPKNL